MVRPYLSPQHKSRVNPEYRKIAEKYSQTHKQMDQLGHFKYVKQKQLNYSERNSESLSETVNRKKMELKWMRNVRQRHLKDIRHVNMALLQKIDRKNSIQQQIEQLRQKSEQARNDNKRNIQYALNKSKRQKMRTSQQVKTQLQQIKHLKLINNQRNEILTELRLKEKQQSKNQAKQKINSFFRHKNKQLLNNYREMLRNEEDRNKRSYTDIEETLKRTEKIENKIRNNKLKLQSLQDKIMHLKSEEKKDITDMKRLYRTANNTTQEFHTNIKKSYPPYDVLMKEVFATELTNAYDRSP